MTSRREIINHALSSMENSGVETVRIADCNEVSQINVFSGAIVNITVTDSHNDKTICGPDREKFYRICHAIAKQYDIYSEMRHYIKENWYAFSLRELPYTALQELLLFMRRLEAQKKHTG